MEGSARLNGESVEGEMAQAELKAFFELFSPLLDGLLRMARVDQVEADPREEAAGELNGFPGL